MDLRFALFERIAQDSVLRRLLVNYADRLDDRALQPGPVGDTCYLTMQWTTGDPTGTCPEGESLIVRAHVPRHQPEERPSLDVVLRRLDAALLSDDADGSITVRRRATSPDAVNTGADTIFKTRIYDVAVVPGRTVRRLPPIPSEPR